MTRSQNRDIFIYKEWVIFFFRDLFFLSDCYIYGTWFVELKLPYNKEKKERNDKMSTKESINKLNKVIECLQEEIVERTNENEIAKKTIAETKKKIKALEKLEAKEREILGDLYREYDEDENEDEDNWS